MGGRSRVLNWFPGHMHKGLRQMQEKVGICDLIVEVRDARAPLASANPLLEYVAARRPRLILLNKADLAASKPLHRCYVDMVRHAGEDGAAGRDAPPPPGAEGGEGRTPRNKKGALTHVLATNARDARDTGRRVLKWAKANATPRFTTGGTMMLVCGLPNVGKSTLINALRGALRAGAGAPDWAKQVAIAGPQAGVTRATQQICISRDPLIHALDTPGIFIPRVADEDAGVRLAMLGCVPERAMDLTELATEILSFLNRQRQHVYVRFLELMRPTDDIQQVFDRVERRCGATGKHYEERERMCARYFIKCFREGHLGRVFLDERQDYAAALKRAEEAARAEADAAAETTAPQQSGVDPRAYAFNLDDLM